MPGLPRPLQPIVTSTPWTGQQYPSQPPPVGAAENPNTPVSDSGQAVVPPEEGPPLHRGIYGPIVEYLQRLLNRVGYRKRRRRIAGGRYTMRELSYRPGYGIPVNGEFGPETERAVVDFQQEHGLVPNGVVGPNTWRALQHALP
jgi:peptidoglycan hydrolase-like protein with peptidoglycan-binding domain